MSKLQSVLYWTIILALVSVTAYSIYKRSLVGVAQDYTFDIENFDRNEILTTHALKYQIKYGVDVCKGVTVATEGYVCMEPRMFSTQWQENCRHAIRGVCLDETFTAGVERFYVRQEFAETVSQKLQTGQPSVVISVSPNGMAQVKDLLIDGVSWQKAP